MSRMTDAEIIKNLEYCTNDDDEPNCKECTKRPHIYCMCELLEEALDLIKRQQERFEQIEKKLEKEIDWMNVLVGDGNFHAECHLEGLKKALRIVQGGGTDDR